MVTKNTRSIIRLVTNAKGRDVGRKPACLEGVLTKHTFDLATDAGCTIRTYEIFYDADIENAMHLMPKLFVKQPNGLLALTRDKSTVVQILDYLETDLRNDVFNALIDAMWDLGYPIKLTTVTEKTLETPKEVDKLVSIVLDTRNRDISKEYRKACAQAIIDHPECDEVFSRNENNIRTTVIKVCKKELAVCLMQAPKVVEGEAGSIQFAKPAKLVDLDAYNAISMTNLNVKGGCKNPMAGLYQDCKDNGIAEVFEAALETVLDQPIEGMKSGILPVQNTIRSTLMFLYSYEDQSIDKVFPLRFPLFQWFSPSKIMMMYGNKCRKRLEVAARTVVAPKASKVFQLLSSAMSKAVSPKWQLVCEWMREDVPYFMVLDADVDRSQGDQIDLGWHMTASYEFTSDLVTQHAHTTADFSCVSKTGKTFRAKVHDYNWGAALEQYFDQDNFVASRDVGFPSVAMVESQLKHGFGMDGGSERLRNYLAFMTIPHNHVQPHEELQVKLKFLSEGIHIKALDRLIAVVKRSNSSAKFYLEDALAAYREECLDLRGDAKRFLNEYEAKLSSEFLEKVEYIPYTPEAAEAGHAGVENAHQ